MKNTKACNDEINRIIDEYDRAVERCKESLVGPLTALLQQFLSAHTSLEEVTWPFNTEPRLACPEVRLDVRGETDQFDGNDTELRELDPSLEGDLDALGAVLGGLVDLYRRDLDCNSELTLNRDGLFVQEAIGAPPMAFVVFSTSTSVDLPIHSARVQ